MQMTTTNTTNPSIYIPRVYANIDWKRIKGVFEEIFGEGNVARVDVVKPYNSEGDEATGKSKFNRVYVHFKKWPEEVHELRKMLLDGGKVQVMYEEPWYWLCLLNRSVRTPDKPVRTKVKKLQATEMFQLGWNCFEPITVERERLQTAECCKSCSIEDGDAIV